jgi:hypothetical protein
MNSDYVLVWFHIGFVNIRSLYGFHRNFKKLNIQASISMCGRIQLTAVTNTYYKSTTKKNKAKRKEPRQF